MEENIFSSNILVTIILSFLVLIILLRLIFKVIPKKLKSCFNFIILVSLVFFVFHQYSVETNVYDIDLNLNKEYKVVQISDLHYNTSFKGVLNSAIKKINKQEPDYVVMTGDYKTDLNSSENLPDNFFETIKKIKAKKGIYAIFGNHDRFGDKNEVIRKFKEAGVIVLQDENVRLDKKLYLAGADYIYGNQLCLKDTLRGIPKGTGVIFLTHSPTGLYNDIRDYSFLNNKKYLFLVGHTHGGQVVMPFADRKKLAEKWFDIDYLNGLEDFKGNPIYINKGIGTSYVPIRLNARPEIAIFNIK